MMKVSTEGWPRAQGVMILLQLTHKAGVWQGIAALPSYEVYGLPHRPAVGGHEIRCDDAGRATHSLHAMDEHAAPRLLERVGYEGGCFCKMAGELLERLIAYRDLHRLGRTRLGQEDGTGHDGEDMGDAERRMD